MPRPTSRGGVSLFFMDAQQFIALLEEALHLNNKGQHWMSTRYISNASLLVELGDQTFEVTIVQK